MQPNYFKIEWPESNDLIPIEWFRRTGESRDKGHDGGGTEDVYCSVVVTATMAELDYGGEYKRTNAANGYWTGCTQLEFTDNSRTRIKKVLWRGAAGKHFRADEEFKSSRVTIENRSALEGKKTLQARKVPKRDRLLARGRRRKAGWSANCDVCNRSLREVYGELAMKAGDVHHMTELNGGERMTSPEELAFLCACCHAILSRKRKNKVSFEQLRVAVLRRARLAGLGK